MLTRRFSWLNLVFARAKARNLLLDFDSIDLASLLAGAAVIGILGILAHGARARDHAHLAHLADCRLRAALAAGSAAGQEADHHRVQHEPRRQVRAPA